MMTPEQIAEILARYEAAKKCLVWNSEVDLSLGDVRTLLDEVERLAMEAKYWEVVAVKVINERDEFKDEVERLTAAVKIWCDDYRKLDLEIRKLRQDKTYDCSVRHAEVMARIKQTYENREANLISERDAYKTIAEALERAIKEHGICYLCVHFAGIYNKHSCNLCAHQHRFELDEARFATKEAGV